MNILIGGAGEVGRYAAEVLIRDGHNVTMIEKSPEVLREMEETFDLRSLAGNCATAEVLREAGCENCDLYIAATDSDELNLLSATVAKAVGASKVIARVHHSTYFAKRGLDYETSLGIDRLICPEYSTALSVARLLSNPGAIAVEDFARGAIELQHLTVEGKASSVGVPLSELKLPKGVRVAMFERDDQVILPKADTIPQSGDTVTLIGETVVLSQARKLFNPGKGRRKNAIIMGGTAAAVWLSRAMKGRSFSIRMFETNRERANELAGKLDHVTVMQADPTAEDTAEEETVGWADVFVAITHDDEHNILAAARAKQMGVQQSIAVLHRPTYLHLIQHVGIDHAFSPRQEAVKEILSQIDDKPVRMLAHLVQDVVAMYEVHPSAGARATGLPLKNIQMPAHTQIAIIHRNNKVKVPGANDVIRDNDSLIITGPCGIEKDIRKLFAG